MNNSVGQTIAHYRIEKVLGQGGMGSAFLALDMQLKRRVALKVMHPHLASNPEFQARFLQEAQAAAALDHPNIIRVHSADYWQGYLYMVMELVTGGSLRDYQKHLYESGKILTLTQTISLISQVADALDYAHSQGMIHRDIKPDNILLKPAPGASGDFRAIITDFGLAKLAEGGVHSMSGQVMGTLAYMAPEQCLGEAVDGRADIYALGIMLYELLVGRLPFAPKSITEAIKLHTQVPPPLLSEMRPGIPAALQQTVNRALAKKPEDRYQKAADLVRDLGVTASNQADRQAITALDSRPEVDNITTYLQSKPIAYEKPAGPAIAAGEKDALILTDPNGVQRTMTLDRPIYQLGRAPGNDISLPHESVSRNHARLELTPDRAGYMLTDLGSRNGTYLGDAKLIANVPERWPDDQMVRIGDFRLQWQMGQERFRYSQQSVQPPASIDVRATSQMTGAVASGLQYQSSGAVQPVAVTINPSQINVQPGSSMTAQIDLLNQSMTVQHFMVRIQGIPEEWGIEPGTPIQLLPGARGQTSVTFSPPRLPTSTAGAHHFRVRVMSTQNGAEIASASGTLNIQPYTELSADFQPKRLRKQGMSRVFVTNKGNVPLGVTLALRDREEALIFTPPTHQLTVPPGQTEEVTFAAAARKQSLLGSQQMLPFEISVNTASGPPQILSGDYLALPRFPTWMAGLATFLCIACAIGAVALIAVVPRLIGANTPTAVAAGATDSNPPPNQTQTAAFGASFTVPPSITAIPIGITSTSAEAATMTVPSDLPTSAPSITPTVPTPTPNIPPGVCTGYPTDGNVNLRSGPGTNYTKIGTLTPGNYLVLIGKNPDGTWYVANGGIIWVAAQFLTLNGPCDTVSLFPTPPPPVTPPTATPTAFVTTPPVPTATPTLPPAVVITPTFPIIVKITAPVIILISTATPMIIPPKEPELQALLDKIIPKTETVIQSGYADLLGDGGLEYLVLTDPIAQFNMWVLAKGGRGWTIIFSQNWQGGEVTQSVKYWIADLTGDGKADFLIEARLQGTGGYMNATGWTIETDKNGNPTPRTIFSSGDISKGSVVKVDKGYIKTWGLSRTGGCATTEWYWIGNGKWDTKSADDPNCTGPK